MQYPINGLHIIDGIINNNPSVYRLVSQLFLLPIKGMLHNKRLSSGIDERASEVLNETLFRIYLIAINGKYQEEGNFKGLSLIHI